MSSPSLRAVLSADEGRGETEVYLLLINNASQEPLAPISSGREAGSPRYQRNPPGRPRRVPLRGASQCLKSMSYQLAYRRVWQKVHARHRDFCHSHRPRHNRRRQGTHPVPRSRVNHCGDPVIRTVMLAPVLAHALAKIIFGRARQNGAA